MTMRYWSLSGRITHLLSSYTAMGSLFTKQPRQPVDMSGAKAEFVKETINKEKVVIFSKSYCPYCVMAKEQFKKLNQQYLAIELDKRDDGDEIQDILFEMTGARTIQNGSSYKAQHDNDEYLEKKGGDGEMVYVTKYHRAGTGGYNHYEAFHTKDNSSYARAKQNSIHKDEDKDKVKKNSSAKQYSANDYNGDDEEDYGDDNEEDDKENHRPKAISYSRNLPEETKKPETSKKHSARIPKKPNPPVVDTQIIHSLDNSTDTSTIKTLSEPVRSREEDVSNVKEPSDDLQEDEESVEDTEEDTESKDAITITTTPKTVSEPKALTYDSDQYDDELDGEIDAVYNISDADENEKPKVEEGDQIKLIAKAIIKSPPEAFVDNNSDQEEISNDQQSSDDSEADTETQLQDLPFADEIEKDPSLDEAKPVGHTSRYDAGDDEEYDEEEEAEEIEAVKEDGAVESKDEQESKEEPEKSEEKKKGSDYEVTEEPDEGDNPHEKPKPPKPIPIKEKKRYKPSKSYFAKDSSESDESSSIDDDRYEKEFTSPRFFETRHIRPSSFRRRPGYPGYETYILHGAHPHSADGVCSHFGDSGSEEDPVVYHRSVHTRRTPKGRRQQKDVFEKYHDDISEENDEEGDSIEDDRDSNDEASTQHEESVEDSDPKLLKLDEVRPSTENLLYHETTDSSKSVESQLSTSPVTEADEGDTRTSSNIPRKREKVKKTKGPIHNKIEIEYTKDDGEDSKVANITLVSNITTERY